MAHNFVDIVYVNGRYMHAKCTWCGGISGSAESKMNCPHSPYQRSFPSPDVSESVFRLTHWNQGFPSPVLLGSAWVVTSGSGRLLVTSYRSLQKLSGSLADGMLWLTRDISRLDGEVSWFLPVPVAVRLLAADNETDVAILEADSILKCRTIPLCPVNEFPLKRKEDSICVYYGMTALSEANQHIIVIFNGKYSKMRSETEHYFYLSEQTLQGSVGGVVVDYQGRAVGLLCDNAPRCSPFDGLTFSSAVTYEHIVPPWLGAVKLNCIKGLYEFIATH